MGTNDGTASAPPLQVGRVGRAHGLRGEVRVALHWPESNTLLEVDEVLLQVAGAAPQRLAVEAARRAGKAVLLKLAGVDDRTAAERLNGADLAVARDSVEPLDPGEYYLADLLGARVVVGEELIGTVEGVHVHPTVDSIVIRTVDGESLEQPLGEHWVSRVDVDAGVIELTSREGLM